MAAQSSLNPDRIHSLLSVSERRYLLHILQESGDTDIDDLARQIEAWTQDKSVEDVSEEACRETVISLVHNHLPRLAEQDVVEYNSETGEVVLLDAFSELKPYLNTESEDIAADLQRYPAD